MADWDSKTKTTRFGKWRMFQIAFILMNIESIINPKSDDRKIVDLIWFPTGGGKTEAYLGLSAFTILYNRITKYKMSGTEVILRYTLRLLTAQQFNRTASLISSLEILRRSIPEKLGENEISIGIFVGKSLTPNKVSGYKGAVWYYDNFINQTEGITRDNYNLLLNKCPHCSKKIGFYGYKETPGIYRKDKEGDEDIRFKCSGNCVYSDSYMPIYVIDEHIYSKLPTIIIGTVDKFAMIAYNENMRKLFGIDVPKKGNHSPPSMIIQDELHLISGPLGSIVGHYESLFNSLSVKDKISPKIITSTATVSMAREQIRDLYGKKIDEAMLFPHPCITYKDSFFSKFSEDSTTGRKYVGIFANNSPSFYTTQIRVYSILLQASKTLKDKYSESLEDAYHSLICYFTSLKN